MQDSHRRRACGFRLAFGFGLDTAPGIRSDPSGAGSFEAIDRQRILTAHQADAMRQIFQRCEWRYPLVIVGVIVVRRDEYRNARRFGGHQQLFQSVQILAAPR